MELNRLKLRTEIIVLFLLISSVYLGFYFNEDSSGGAIRDYNNNIIQLLDLKTNFTDCKDVKNYSLTGDLYEFILTSNNLQFCKGR